MIRLMANIMMTIVGLVVAFLIGLALTVYLVHALLGSGRDDGSLTTTAGSAPSNSDAQQNGTSRHHVKLKLSKSLRAENRPAHHRMAARPLYQPTSGA